MQTYFVRIVALVATVVGGWLALAAPIMYGT